MPMLALLAAGLIGVLERAVGRIGILQRAPRGHRVTVQQPNRVAKVLHATPRAAATRSLAAKATVALPVLPVVPRTAARDRVPQLAIPVAPAVPPLGR